MRPELDKFFRSLSEKKLLQVNNELAQNKFDGIVETIGQVIIREYGVEPLYVVTVISNKVHEILSNRYAKLKTKLKKEIKRNKNESKKS
jgi:hypothetical protein